MPQNNVLITHKSNREKKKHKRGRSPKTQMSVIILCIMKNETFLKISSIVSRHEGEYMNELSF